MACCSRIYCYEDTPSTTDYADGRAEDIAQRERTVAASSKIRFIIKIARGFL